MPKLWSIINVGNAVSGTKPARLIADLHLHSLCSDGRLGPAELVDCVAQAGVRLITLTDHDTVEGHPAAAERARKLGLQFVAGIEMTTYGCGQVIHALGFAFDASSVELQRTNERARMVWDANQCRWVRELAAQGWEVDVFRDFPDHPVRLPVLIERLCLRGIDEGDPRRVHQRFRSFFSSLPPEAYDGLPSTAEAARIIRDCGGVLLLAHPLALLRQGLLGELLDDCDGLEATYLRYSEEEQLELQRLAQARGKLVSGGSDYHGFFEPAYRPPAFSPRQKLREALGIARELAD